jgi:hypothetical protein
MSRVQAARKDQGLEFTDRVEVRIDGSERLLRVARDGAEEISRECLATRVLVGERGPESRQHELGEVELSLSVQKAGE